MKVYTLDNIVRQVLSEREYSMHWYLNFLTYGVTAIRELNFDVLQNVKSVRLPINSYNAAALPCDFVDFIRVGDELGQYIDPWGEKESFNRLNKFDEQGNKVKYPDVEAQNTYLPSNYDGLWYTNYANDRGELLGRVYNAKPAFKRSFLIIRERGEIQLADSFKGTSITMDYITDGTSIDASNAIHPYAIETIKSFIVYKMKENGRHFNMGDRQMAKEEYYNQLRILKGRMNDMDVNMIRRSLASGYWPTIKN